MALAANSYGSTANVAKLVPQHATAAGTFDPTTNPPLAFVETEMDQISALMNAMLAGNGFDIPITDADTKTIFDGFVEKLTAEIVKSIRGGGRFGPLLKRGRKTLQGYVLDDIEGFIESISTGLDRLGATRSTDPLSTLGYRGSDEGGDDTFPIFQRDGFGNRFTDWDS